MTEPDIDDIEQQIVYLKFKDGNERFEPENMTREEVIETLAYYLNYYINEAPKEGELN